MRSRDELITALQATTDVDVLIVGGGINGVGLFRDLAAQGIGALLVERGDFCSGTSAAPSRLIHGGLRYLETGEFALVRESVEERNRLLLNAPHLVRPIPVWVPLQSWWAGLGRAPARFFGWTRAPGAKGALVTKLGLMFYDWFGRNVGGVPRHRLIGAEQMREQMPSIAGKVKMAAEFFDARLLHPERLTLELVADAERDCPAAMAISYLSLDSNQSDAVQLRDQLNGRIFNVRPKLVINTSGVWVDQVDDKLGVHERLVGGTRGSHLVMRQPALARELGDRMIYFETADHRICLAYCLTDELVLVGTTDIRTDDPDDHLCTEQEIDYLFEAMREIMPRMALDRSQIVFSYSGVRPLPAAQGVVEGAISRDHSIRTLPATGERPYDILTLVGGKWTTYRACAAQIADEVLKRMRRERKVDTSSLPIGSAHHWPHSASATESRIEKLGVMHGLSTRLATALLDRYGDAADDVARTIALTSPAPIDGLPGYAVGELLYIAQQQRVVHLADVVLRRTLIAIEGRCTEPALRMMAAVLGGPLNWDGPRRASEVADTVRLLRQRHGVTIAADPRAAPLPAVAP